MESQSKFSEKQYFRQPLVIGLLVLVNLFFIVGFVQQIVLGYSFGIKSASDSILILFLIVTWLVTYFVLTSHLATTISTQGITYQFVPFQRKPRLIAWHEIKGCYVRTYSPLKEYGGWGYRNYPQNSAYNVSGTVGIQMVLHTGEFVLLGTNKGAQAREAISSVQNIG